MAQGLPKSQLHDIPLTVVDHGDTLRESDKLHHSKSNSLRRFFKMPHKKGAGGSTDQMQEAPSEMQLETDATNYAEVVDPETALQRKKVQSGSQRRFHLRLGGMNKYSNDAAMDASDKNNGPSASGSNCSKPTLKGSISSYWNTVFKRHNLSHSKGDASIPTEVNEMDLPQVEDQAAEKGDIEKNQSGEEEPEEEGEDDDDLLNNEMNVIDEVHTLPLSEDVAL